MAEEETKDSPKVLMTIKNLPSGSLIEREKLLETKPDTNNTDAKREKPA